MNPLRPVRQGAGPAIRSSAGAKDGGAGRNRTDDRGFAVLGLTTWRPRHHTYNFQ